MKRVVARAEIELGFATPRTLNVRRVERVDQQGTIFGEISALLEVMPTATVAAVEPVECWVIDYFDRFKEIPGMAIAIARILARRLQSVTERIRSSAAEIESDPEANINLADLLSGIESDLTIDWKSIDEMA